MTTDWDGLAEARRRLPIGSRVNGVVRLIPKPGAIGVFIDLDEATIGVVDVLWLPADPALWPSVGTTIDFEVLQHRPSQVRLWPLDPQWRSKVPHQIDDGAWTQIRSSYVLGQLVSGRTTSVFPSNHEYIVTFEKEHAVLEWSNEPPTIGAIRNYRISNFLDTTRRILLVPASLEPHPNPTPPGGQHAGP